MTYKEIASIITGISFPLFGISWNPTQPDIAIAKQLITYLEDRRVLYNAYQLENPEYCYQSVIEIRAFLTEKLIEVRRGSELDQIMRGMRAACRNVLDSTTHIYNIQERLKDRHLHTSDQIGFFSAIGVFRGNMGILIAQTAIMYGIDFEQNLMSIIPTNMREDE